MTLPEATSDACDDNLFAVEGLGAAFGRGASAGFVFVFLGSIALTIASGIDTVVAIVLSLFRRLLGRCRPRWDVRRSQPDRRLRALSLRPGNPAPYSTPREEVTTWHLGTARKPGDCADEAPPEEGATR